jgi:hypothetical protein
LVGLDSFPSYLSSPTSSSGWVDHNACYYINPRTQILDKWINVMAAHPNYLDPYLRTHNFIMRGDGPLPYNVRHYIALMVSCSVCLSLPVWKNHFFHFPVLWSPFVIACCCFIDKTHASLRDWISVCLVCLACLSVWNSLLSLIISLDGNEEKFLTPSPFAISIYLYDDACILSALLIQALEREDVCLYFSLIKLTHKQNWISSILVSASSEWERHGFAPVWLLCYLHVCLPYLAIFFPSLQSFWNLLMPSHQ